MTLRLAGSCHTTWLAFGAAFGVSLPTSTRTGLARRSIENVPDKRWLELRKDAFASQSPPLLTLIAGFTPYNPLYTAKCRTNDRG